MAVLALVLAACGSVAPLPEEVFLRLTVLMPASPASGHASPGELRVAPLVASGLHKERALAYTRDGGQSLQLSHDEFWIDSPEQLLQQALAACLRGALHERVVTEASPQVKRFVTGRITRFEQQFAADGTSMVAGLELTVREVRHEHTLFSKTYVETEALEEATPTAVARAMSRAVGTICATFVGDAGDTLKPSFARESAP